MANSAFQIPATPNPLPVANGGILYFIRKHETALRDLEV